MVHLGDLVMAGDVNAVRVGLAVGLFSVEEVLEVVVGGDHDAFVPLLGEVSPGGLGGVLVSACVARAFRVFDACLSAGADVNFLRDGWASPLVISVSHRWGWGVSRLLRAGANVTGVVAGGWRLDRWRPWRLRWVWWLCAFAWARERFRNVIRS